jgi:hypothetical protein
MAVFIRRRLAPRTQANYAKYREEVREDFSECCAYCLLHERISSGRESFELDHFRPKSLPQFAHQVNDFYNIYYSCHVCNRSKGAKWPDDELLSNGYRFLDLCVEDFSQHFREENNGFWTPLTKPAEYTEERLRLNRPHLMEIRKFLRQLAALKSVAPIDWDSPSRNTILFLMDDA